jgi:hypothetical protein
VAGDTLTLRAISHEGGEVIDRVTLHEAPRPSGPLETGDERISQWDFLAGDLTASFGAGRLRFDVGPGGATAARAEFGTTSSFGLPHPREGSAPEEGEAPGEPP